MHGLVMEHVYDVPVHACPSRSSSIWFSTQDGGKREGEEMKPDIEGWTRRFHAPAHHLAAKLQPTLVQSKSDMLLCGLTLVQSKSLQT